MTISLCRRLRGGLTALLLAWVSTVPDIADGKASGIIMVKDVLTLPNQTVRIEARLSGKTSMEGQTWDDVPLQLFVDGQPVATASTGAGGQAGFDYTPKVRGTHVIAVTVVETASVEAEKGEATLCVWERRRPILLVEMEALIQPDEPTTPPSPVPTGKEAELPAHPLSNAAEELSRLTQYYYNVVYVPTGDQLSAMMKSVGGARRWLSFHKFPVGFVVSLPYRDVNTVIEGFKQGGWTTMKTGIGRTRSFADTLLHHRMEVVVVPEPPKGELPRKAKAAKNWQEVRKKL